MTKKISDKTLETAKTRFMNYEPVAEIARDLKINRSSLQYYADKSWNEERNISRIELLEHATESKKKDFITMTQASIKILSKALENLARRDEPPSIREASKVAEILTSLDKITRLDDNKPTEITGTDKPITVIELKERLSKDPFTPKELIYEIDEDDS